MLTFLSEENWHFPRSKAFRALLYCHIAFPWSKFYSSDEDGDGEMGQDRRWEIEDGFLLLKLLRSKKNNLASESYFLYQHRRLACVRENFHLLVFPFSYSFGD